MPRSFNLPAQLAARDCSILVRSTNWIGDAIMTLPAVRTIRENFPEARITVLAQPWVAEIFAANPYVDQVILYQKRGQHGGLRGMWRLARDLARERFDLAILLQNAFEAAFLCRLAGIPRVAGYNRDARRLLLTHPVPVSREIKARHQVYYYQHLMASLGLTPGSDSLYLALPDQAKAWADDLVRPLARPIIGLNPGAAYGPAKCWPAERYAQAAKALLEGGAGACLVFGTGADQMAAATIRALAGERVVDVAGQTTLSQAMALIGRCDAFITNDSGLMHVAAAQDTPLVAIFGSTDSVATGPFSRRAKVVSKSLPCSPCLQTHCPTNFACMTAITPEEVVAVVRGLLGEAG